MRDDQYARLKALQETLTDVALAEADPAAWSGAGKTLAELTRDERGNRYFDKKNAAATLTLLMKTVSLTGHIERNAAGLTPPEPLPNGADDLDDEVRSVQKQAAALLKQIEKRGQRGRTN